MTERPKTPRCVEVPTEVGETLIQGICQHWRPISPEMSEIFTKKFKTTDRQEFSDLLSILEVKKFKKPVQAKKAGNK